MTIISDLPWDLVEEILSRTLITSLRAVGSTCKRWNTLSKDERYDKKNNHKVLRFVYDFDGNVRHEIYDFKSNSWRVLVITYNSYITFKRGVSLKGNTYFVDRKDEESLICFDFTTKRFGPCLHLPFDFNGYVIPS
ncbi:hypothetical protein ARALYDRAFT_899057 [Arabidopsis lyrata subsp. lyrata]|uniref:F-box domain-containing protein n=1 Tax=Arabidopsis lyrata subsp. lyrata TaxID=81972 RepID=D7L567_ARALL|nr:hypothetical protein ARALYDRAFT_899057 [Arabidopsis lyrata subsp. lyrata]